MAASTQALRASKKHLRNATTVVLKTLSSVDVSEQSAVLTKMIFDQPFFEKSRRVSCYLSMPEGEVDTSALVQGILKSGKILFVPKIVKQLSNIPPPPPAPSSSSIQQQQPPKKEESHMRMLRIYSEEDLASLPAGLWGIREPPTDWLGNKREDAFAIGGKSEDTTPTPTLGSRANNNNLEDAEAEAASSADPGGLDLILVPGLVFDRSFSRLGHGKGYYDRFISSYTSSRPKPVLVGVSLTQQLLPAGHIPMGDHDWKMDWIVTAEGILCRGPQGI